MPLRKVRLLIIPMMLVLLGLVANTAAASNGSIVYLKNYNVWLSNPDGTNSHQVTRGGTFEHPWLSPTQADDGTIAASYLNDIVRMEQNGNVLNRMDPPPLINSVSHPMDGVPVEVNISPNGKLIAYTFVAYECPIAAECGVRKTTGYTAADKLTPPAKYGSTYFGQVSWVGNGRTIQSGGYGSQINFHDLGKGDPVHWFDDSDVYEPSTDLADADLSSDGKHLAAIRGYGSSSQVIWYTVSGNAKTGAPPAAPAPECNTGELEGLAGPTWAPDGQALAWEEPDGIWSKSNPDDCASPQPAMAIPGGSAPDWGPAAVNPGPLPKPRLKVTVTRGRLVKVLKKGLKIKVKSSSSGKVKAKVRKGKKVVASGAARANSRGVAKITAKFSRKARRALAKSKRVKLTVTANAAGQTGKAKVVIKK